MHFIIKGSNPLMNGTRKKPKPTYKDMVNYGMIRPGTANLEKMTGKSLSELKKDPNIKIV